MRHAQHGGDDRQRGDGPQSELARRRVEGRARLAAVLDGAARRAETIKAALPELAQQPSQYVTGGRYFRSIEIPEGGQLDAIGSVQVGAEDI
ncbi:MAG: hypothetical protein ACREE9_22325 [Stellaceae bacterium]